MPDNGIKFFAKGGGKLDDALEAKIEERLGESWQRPVGVDVGRVVTDESAQERYIYHLLSSVSTPLRGLKIVVDCANGASSRVAPKVYTRAGAEVIAISAEPNGWNINENCGSTHLENLKARVIAEGADLGIAHDGDADRCLAVDGDGNEIDGDFIMAILAEDMKREGTLKNNRLVATVMSNLGLVHAMKKLGIELSTTAVGDRYVLEKMAEDNDSLGGEQSGHVILRNHANTGDGILTALTLMQVVVRTGKSLRELAAVMDRFPQVLINVKDVQKEKLGATTSIAELIAKRGAEFGDSGRILVRPSGTEALVRVMVEAETDTKASEVAEEIAALVRLELQ